MMRVLNGYKTVVSMIDGYKDRKIKKTLATGDKELTFLYPVKGPGTEFLLPENYIETQEDQFVIKRLETKGQYREYTAVLNVEELEEKKYISGIQISNQTIQTVLDSVIAGTGWTVQYAMGTQKTKSISIEDPVSAWDILQKCLARYKAECRIDSKNKVVTICDMVGEDRGVYLMDGLNLRKLSYIDDSYEFYTRIIPVGKDGLQINNDGKNYVENYQYSTKPKTYVWKDERYTSAASLMEDAEEMLEEKSKPLRAYTADVIDLAKANPEYSVLEYDIGDTVTLVSDSTGIRTKQRIVEITLYPEEPERNTVEISTALKTYAELINERMNEAYEKQGG